MQSKASFTGLYYIHLILVILVYRQILLSKCHGFFQKQNRVIMFSSSVLQRLIGAGFNYKTQMQG